MSLQSTYTHPQTVADDRWHSGQRPAFVVEAVRGRTLAEFLLEHGELGVGDGRGVRRSGRAQDVHAALAPGTAPAFHQPHTHPQILRYHDGLLTRGEPLAGLKPDPFTKRPTLSGQAPTLRITHTPGIPATTMNRQHPTTTQKPQ
ncbi:hypothetical protein GCM10010493_75480 [Streptomyces lavendulae subsp. grasserius]